MVPIGWVAVGDPAHILPPDQHDAIWAIQKPLDFPATAYGLSRSPDPAFTWWRAWALWHSIRHRSGGAVGARLSVRWSRGIRDLSTRSTRPHPWPPHDACRAQEFNPGEATSMAPI